MKGCQWLVAGSMLLGCAQAGDVQLGARIGKAWLDVDAERLSSGNRVNTGLLSLGITAAYRGDAGGYIEAGTSSAFDFGFVDFNALDEYWLGLGWQFEPSPQWRFTPKAGVVRSTLESEEEDFFAGDEPRDKIRDVSAFVELTAERRFGRVFGLNLHYRYSFVDFGDARTLGVGFSWTIR